MGSRETSRAMGWRMNTVVQSYRAQLSAHELIVTIRGLLEQQRAAERLLCRYLADLADRIEARGFGSFGGYSDIYHASSCLFGMSKRRTRECVRVGRALRALPGIERAFVDGELSYSRVREVTRVAGASDEDRWLRLAMVLPMRVLERRVAEAGGPAVCDDKNGQPAEVTWHNPESVQLRLTLRPEVWALLQRAMENARRDAQGDALLSDCDALEAVARDALAQQAASESADVRRAVVLYECSSCRRTELDTGCGAMELGAAAAGTLGCGAAVHDLATEGRIERCSHSGAWIFGPRRDPQWVMRWHHRLRRGAHPRPDGQSRRLARG